MDTRMDDSQFGENDEEMQDKEKPKVAYICGGRNYSNSKAN